VTSIIASPAADPHSYEPTAADGRALATAQLAIVNGVDYDPWAPRLLSANPVGGRRVINVGKLFGLPNDGNPHRWYDPAEVSAVAAAIAADLARLDPADAAYYASRRARFETTGLRRYHALIDAIRARFAGTPVGASESIFALLAPALGLRLLTPPGFMRAISEGTEVTAQDLVTAQRQISDDRIRLWVYNSQNTTPQVQQLTSLARARGIPVATITETLTPAGASFQTWQAAQLARIFEALGPR
jgi:zinc/manganese transport system substrate-binding protein